MYHKIVVTLVCTSWGVMEKYHEKWFEGIKWNCAEGTERDELINSIRILFHESTSISPMLWDSLITFANRNLKKGCKNLYLKKFKPELPLSSVFRGLIHTWHIDNFGRCIVSCDLADPKWPHDSDNAHILALEGLVIWHSCYSTSLGQLLEDFPARNLHLRHWQLNESSHPWERLLATDGCWRKIHVQVRYTNHTDSVVKMLATIEDHPNGFPLVRSEFSSRAWLENSHSALKHSSSNPRHRFPYLWATVTKFRYQNVEFHSTKHTPMGYITSWELWCATHPICTRWKFDICRFWLRRGNHTKWYFDGG